MEVEVRTGLLTVNVVASREELNIIASDLENNCCKDLTVDLAAAIRKVLDESDPDREDD